MAEQNPMAFIESADGGLFRGYHYGAPEQIWDAEAREFVPYKGEVPKPEGWGYFVDEERARELMGDEAA